MSNPIATLLRAADFAAIKHKDQRRKGSDSDPYINHPLSVARYLIEVGGIEDPDILAAAILHDTVEDTETTAEDLAELFGERVSSLMMEVTDDKSLDKQVRKRLQVEHAPGLSPGAKLIKLADKISNIEDIISNPPMDWSQDRCVEYVEWGKEVVAGLRGSNAKLEKLFDELCESAAERCWQA